ncbi:MAG TPA: pyridoxamine 5'-phosphate oxidase family protein, partial [Thermomicrobiales bacterium]|nr:pyridoxamine 5'-phosphate oxidase family protein [Thermomicrobiales bacterium]
TLDRATLARDAVRTIDELEAIVGAPTGVARDKVSPHLTPLMRAYVAQSPFYLLATASADGACDVSPRGDPAGAIRIVDETTLILPDRAGNKRVDSLRNIVHNPRVGLLVLVPGMDETLRINGRATITRNADVLAAMPMQGKTPKLAIVVDIDEAFMHCARAFRRSALWRPESWPELGDVPSMAAILHDQLHLGGTVADLAREREERYRTTLY